MRLAEASRGVAKADRGVAVERGFGLEQFGIPSATEHSTGDVAVTPLNAEQALALAAELIAAAEASESATASVGRSSALPPGRVVGRGRSVET